MENSIYEAVHLKKTVDSLIILNDISLTLKQGEILGIYGSNASSKSTLVKALAGITGVDSGSFIINGKCVRLSSPVQAATLGILAILGDEQIHTNLSVAENIFLGTYAKYCHPAAKPRIFSGFYSYNSIQKSAVKLLNNYSCDIPIDAPVASLSSAQCRMLLVLRAVARSVRILLIDDCFADMDDVEAAFFIRFLRQISSEGVSIIFASQNYFQLQELADSVMLIKDGTLYSTISSEDMILEKRSQFPYPKLPLSAGSVLYKCTDLCYKNILNNISLEIHQGEIIGLLGASGSGRTTLAKTICGFYKPTSGKTLFNNVHLNISSPVAAKKYGISMISSSSLTQGLIPQMTVQDNVTLSNLRTVTYQHLPFIISRRKMQNYSYDMVSRLGIDENKITERITYLSKGIQKKIAFAKSAFSGAQFFVLDEPTKDVDRAGKIQIYNLITELAYEQNGILLFTSDIEEALGMCDRILILRNGSIIHETRPCDTSSAMLHKLIYN